MSRTPPARPHPRTISSPDCADPLYAVIAALAPAWTGQFASRVAAGAALGFLPAFGPPAVARMPQSGIHEWRQLAMDGLLFTGVPWTASGPASLAVLMTVLRGYAGCSARPVGDNLLCRILGLTIELAVAEGASGPAPIGGEEWSTGGLRGLWRLAPSTTDAPLRRRRSLFRPHTRGEVGKGSVLVEVACRGVGVVWVGEQAVDEFRGRYVEPVPLAVVVTRDEDGSPAGVGALGEPVEGGPLLRLRPLK